jgi:uncharacterized surface protein with fasciclin (FAS1) repeats
MRHVTIVCFVQNDSHAGPVDRNYKKEEVRQSITKSFTVCIPCWLHVTSAIELNKQFDKKKKSFMKLLKNIGLMMIAAFFTNTTFAQQTTVEVGGAPMYPSRNIVENAVNSKDHTTLVAAVKAAGLVETLESPGPFTVFAPTNEAFDKLPKGTVETLVKPENKAKLTGILTYHVVAGRLDSKALADLIKAGNGTAELTTVAGGKLWVMMKGKKIVLKDEAGGMAVVTIKDVYQSNGVIHVIDHVLLPK